jgi:hypothetical protein
MPVYLLDGLSPHTRVATAIAPFLIAMALRFMLGKGRITGLLVTLSTLWFATNVLLAPFSSGMQQDIERLGRAVR